MHKFHDTYVLGIINGVISTYMKYEDAGIEDENLAPYVNPSHERSFMMTMLNNGILQRSHPEAVEILVETLETGVIPLVEKSDDLLHIYVLHEYSDLSPAARGICRNLITMAIARGRQNGGEFMAELLADYADIRYIESVFDEVAPGATEDFVLFARNPSLVDAFNRVNAHMQMLQKERPFPAITS